MSNLSGKTLFIIGASRGIGRAIALRAARDGANVAIAAKSSVANPKLPGTIHSVAAEVEVAGGKALALQCDIREEDAVRAAIAATVDTFGGIDILVNNASAIWLRGTLDTPMKRFDLMQQVNARGTFLCSQACLPHLLRAPNPHILTLAPPPALDPKWWAPHIGYTLAKMGMSFVTLGLAGEFGPRGVAVNALWPRTLIATDALNMIAGVSTAIGRKPELIVEGWLKGEVIAAEDVKRGGVTIEIDQHDGQLVGALATTGSNNGIPDQEILTAGGLVLQRK